MSVKNGKNGRKKTASKTAGMPALIPQPNGSALLAGGVLGNRGGTGRPPDVIRAEFREAFADRKDVLTKYADGADGDYALRAMDLLGKYGLGQTKELTVEHIRSRLQAQLDVLAEELDDKTLTRLMPRLREVWTR